MTENDPVKTALNKAMAICATNEHCIEDIRIKLDSWGLRGTDAGSIIDILVKENFINERRYAEAFVTDKYRQNKWGRLKIAALLRAKRIPQELISTALDSLDEDQYRHTIKELLASHRRVTRAKNAYEMKGKLIRFGLSRGFESHLLYDILNEPEDEGL